MQVFFLSNRLNVLSFFFLPTEKPEERTTSVEKDRLQPAAAAAKPLPPEDLFGSVPFVASAGKS